MEIDQTDEQICQYLSLKWVLARALKRNIEYLAVEIKIQLTAPIRMEQEMKLIKNGHAARKKELRTTLGEISDYLPNCKLCPTHTTQNNQSYPNTVNKNTGNYIKIQPTSAEINENIKKLIVVKKAEHYVIEHPNIIKVVIKGLPTTDVADIESELKEKGFAVEKVAQIRDKSPPLPLFMVELKCSEEAKKIYDIKNLVYLTVSIVPFRKKLGITQCFNCNYFNHASKNCRMAPRCLKCVQNHCTSNCTKTDRLQTPHCINCNTDGHMATHRQCSKFPKQKTKKDENPTNEKGNKIAINHRPVTPNVRFGVTKQLTRWSHKRRSLELPTGKQMNRKKT
ncbi:nucleic-acid-binding protein from transposon X-element [Trichonephila clavipes]|nr:nucleic-acid-binding protein from transposon X-element [Trichonephila clavipes]